MAVRRSAPAEVENGSRLPEVVDWLVALVVAIVGLILAVAGSVLAFAIDHDLIAEAVEREPGSAEVVGTELTEPEVIEVARAILTWSGVGLLLVGVGLIVFGSWFAVSRHRSHANPEDAGGGSFLAFATTGAVVTTLSSFVPFSAVVGGAVAGYLERAESERTAAVGALSGVLHVLPVGIVLVFVVAGIWVGFGAIGESGIAIILGGLLVVAFGITAAVSVGLAALGGYIGGRLAAW